MKLSTRFRYGTRFMIDLARAYNNGPVTMNDIVKRERVSKKYMEQIVYRLISARLVKSVRGPKGGYVLTRAPEKVRLIDLYNILEGALVLVPCLADPKSCELVKTCAAREMWKSMQQKMEIMMKKNTLKSLAKGNHK
jgi:Rrf2 family protein